MNVQQASRQILVHGLVLVMVGLLWGLVIPHTPYPRLALGAHTQLEFSGMLFLIMATLLLALPHQVGSKSVSVMLASAWLNWVMVLSEMGNAWWGTTQILPLAAAQAGATGGLPWQEAVVKLAHIVPGFALVLAWALLVIGFIRKNP